MELTVGARAGMELDAFSIARRREHASDRKTAYGVPTWAVARSCVYEMPSAFLSGAPREISPSACWPIGPRIAPSVSSVRLLEAPLGERLLEVPGSVGGASGGGSSAGACGEVNIDVEVLQAAAGSAAGSGRGSKLQ